MSVGTKLLQAAAGNAGSDPVYVDDVFSTHLYDGESSTSTTITINNGLDLSDKGGLLWTKSRGGAYPHYLIDSERGHGTGAILYSNLTNAATNSSFSTAFTSTGYTMKGGYDGFSQSSTSYGSPYVSWAFAKQEKFFDIVTYTGNATSGRTVSHNLGSVPGMIIVKNTSSAKNWTVYHRGVNGGTNPEQYRLLLNSSNAQNSSATGDWNDTAPTSTEFTLGNAARTNENGSTYVAYLFAHNEQEFGEDSDEAIIKCDSFTTDGNGDAAITLGFEPQWLLIKRTDQSNGWWLADSMRGLVAKGSGGDAYLVPNADYAEDSTYTNYIYPTATGFEMDAWGSSGTYIYMAIARSHKPATEFAATDLHTAAYMTSGPPLWNSNFPVDSGWYKQRAGSGSSVYLFSRLTDGGYMQTHSDGAESSAGAGQFDFQDGWYNSNQSATTYMSWMFRRARGFFDVVAYSGTGSQPRTLAHNLGVIPELAIFKERSASDSWVVFSAFDTSTYTYGFLTSGDFASQAYGSGSRMYAKPTASQFSLTDYASMNDSGQTYIAYLFATVAGISKVGSYTGTGSDLNVDCGFSAGARFVLIKRTDSTGDWYLFDSLRGIVAGNDEYALLNTAAADVTNTDYIDPLSSGFTVTSSAPAGLNASSGTYIFLAIA